MPVWCFLLTMKASSEDTWRESLPRLHWQFQKVFKWGILLLETCVCVWLHCVWLCNPMDCSPPGSPVHGILQARALEWVAIPFFRGSSRPTDQSWVSCIAGGFFTIWATREAQGRYSSYRLLKMGFTTLLIQTTPQDKKKMDIRYNLVEDFSHLWPLLSNHPFPNGYYISVLHTTYTTTYISFATLWK